MIKPMLCKEESKPFNKEGFIWENKLDGIRILAQTDSSGSYQLQARSGSDKTKLFPELKLRTKSPAIIDGEIVCYGVDGKSNFNNIQHRTNRQSGILSMTDQYPVTYEIFDVLEVDGHNLQGGVLAARKAILNMLVIPSDNVHVVSYTEDGIGLFEKAKSEQLEGVVGKSLNGLYHEGKREWLKVKVWHTEVFLAVGYTEGTGWRASTFGSLVLSDFPGNYVGGVGSGFNNEDIKRIYDNFVPGTCPFTHYSGDKARWIKPFEVSVRFLEKTSDGILRFPSYKGG